MIDEIQKNLEFVYGKNTAVLAAKRIRRKIAESDNRSVNGETFFSEKSLFLITYADLLRKEGQSPLGTLSSFLTEYLTEAFSTVHILPFFPYSSDDGFAVMDYSKVLSDYGSWEDIRTLAKRFSLMFDLVLNHISAQSQWFQQYLRGEEGFSLLAIEVDPSTDLSDVFRPRSTSLLTEFTKRNGEPVSLWTTFGADQVDFNFADIEILLLLVDVLLFFLRQGASVIRLDAIAYLWKEIGTSCIHLPQTHAIVRLFRSILQAVNDHALLLTETNVPHEENIQYFGNGYDEAHMVYNFSLPPLILYTFIEEDTTQLKDWLAGLDTPSEQTTYLNFTASHDGIGVLPLVDRVGKTGIDKVIERVVENGGSVSYKTNADGTRSPYEINITYVDALKKQEGPTPDNQLAERFLATQSIPLVLPGIPAVYFHSLLGSRNWKKGVEQTGRARTINREKLELDALLHQIRETGSFRNRVFFPYLKMLAIRRSVSTFHPSASFELIDTDPRVFAVQRSWNGQTVLALTNVSSESVHISKACAKDQNTMIDLLGGGRWNPEDIQLDPYEILWLSS